MSEKLSSKHDIVAWVGETIWASKDSVNLMYQFMSHVTQQQGTRQINNRTMNVNIHALTVWKIFADYNKFLQLQ